MGIPDPRGGHGHRRRTAEHSIQVAPRAERGGGVVVHSTVGRARRPSRPTPGGRSRERRHSLA